MDVVESDIRVATRHPCEMGLEESSDGGIVLREAYWREREAMTHVRCIIVVYANWCPHCVPTTVEPMKQCAAELGAEPDLIDIDAEEGRGDRLVRECGDRGKITSYRRSSLDLTTAGPCMR